MNEYDFMPCFSSDEEDYKSKKESESDLGNKSAVNTGTSNTTFCDDCTNKRFCKVHQSRQVSIFTLNTTRNTQQSYTPPRRSEHNRTPRSYNKPTSTTSSSSTTFHHDISNNNTLSMEDTNDDSKFAIPYILLTKYSEYYLLFDLYAKNIRSEKKLLISKIKRELYMNGYHFLDCIFSGDYTKLLILVVTNTSVLYNAKYTRSNNEGDKIIV